MADILHAEPRTETGTKRMRRLRAAGKVPAVLYGHKTDNLHLTLDLKQLHQVINHGGHTVNLTGAANEPALIKHLQWDEVAHEVIHVDLARVDLNEMVEIALSVELKGTAKGVSEGGVMNHVVHEVTIECPVANIPDRLEVRIFDLELGGSIRAADIPLPEGARLVTSGNLVIASCNRPVVVDDTAAAGGPAEPELIGRKKTEENADDK